MRKVLNICDRCGVNSSLSCDLITVNQKGHLKYVSWWPWINNHFDLCESCSEKLSLWMRGNLEL
jgi:hypothetical protein